MGKWADDEKPADSWVGEHEASRIIAEIIQRAVRKHFPEARLQRFARHDSDTHTDIDGIRFFQPQSPDLPKSGYATGIYFVPGEGLFKKPTKYERKSGAECSEAETRRRALMDDLWKIFVGYSADVSVLEPAAEGADPYDWRPRVGTSRQEGGGDLTVVIHGDPRRLLDEVQGNIDYNTEVADLVPPLPKRSRDDL